MPPPNSTLQWFVKTPWGSVVMGTNELIRIVKTDRSCCLCVDLQRHGHFKKEHNPLKLLTFLKPYIHFPTSTVKFIRTAGFQTGCIYKIHHVRPQSQQSI